MSMPYVERVTEYGTCAGLRRWRENGRGVTSSVRHVTATAYLGFFGCVLVLRGANITHFPLFFFSSAPPALTSFLSSLCTSLFCVRAA